MKDTLKEGIGTTRKFEIDRDRTIDFLAGEGDDRARVYATPALIEDVETTCRDFLLTHLEEGEDSLGTWVNIKHLAPTLLGMWAEVSISVSSVDGKAVSFDISVRDGIDEMVAKGRHDRFVIDVEQTKGRLLKKAEAWAKEA